MPKRTRLENERSSVRGFPRLDSRIRMWQKTISRFRDLTGEQAAARSAFIREH